MVVINPMKTFEKTTTNCPKKVQLQVGKVYLYCTCEYSNVFYLLIQNQPFCDETCKVADPEKKPLEFTVKEEQRIWYICNCKKTNSEPICDGTHSSLDW